MSKKAVLAVALFGFLAACAAKTMEAPAPAEVTVEPTYTGKYK
ncbi:hypothetical protein [Phaeovulum sp. W22_SRMD_FR3]|jgi:uncharacterized lipoprotein YbaY